MKLLSATFISVAGVPDTTLSFGEGVDGETARPLTVVTGPPASGKTRLLEAILAAKDVIGPYGQPPMAHEWIRSGENAAKIQLTFGLDEDEVRFTGGIATIQRAEALFKPQGSRYEADAAFVSLLERYDHDGRFGKFDYFPANRSVVQGAAAHGLAAIEQRLCRTTRDPRKYAFLPRFLVQLTHDAHGRARFEAALEKLSPTVRYAGSRGDDDLVCFSSNGRPRTRATELASSEADAVIVAATNALIGHERSVVFVDRPELYQGEAGAAQFLSALQGLATELQLIVATSSPAILASVEPSCVIHLAGPGPA